MVLGQQVSTAAARTHAARLVEQHGTPISDPGGTLTHLFPSVADLAAIDPDTLGLPAARQRCVAELITALAEGTVDLNAGTDWDRARHQLAKLAGIGPWTSEMIAMRGFGDPDAFPATDLGVRNAAALFGLPVSPAALAAHAPVASLARLCGAVPVGGPRPPDQPLATQRASMTVTQSRTVNSPVRPLTLAGSDGTFTSLRMQDQTYPPSGRHRWRDDPNTFGEIADQLDAREASDTPTPTTRSASSPPATE